MPTGVGFSPLTIPIMSTQTEHTRREILALFDADRNNLKAALKHADREALTQMHNLQRLVADCFRAFLAQEDTHKRLSAFAIYQIEAIHLVERACMQALCWYYGIGTAMLRMALEALIRGAFWEGMAHPSTRDSAQIVRSSRGAQVGDQTKRLHDLFADVFSHAPQAERELDLVSAGIFDRVSFLFSTGQFTRVVPPFRVMVGQVAEWGFLHPIADPAATIYDGVYWKLSEDAHIIPDKTLLGRRFVAGKEAFPTVEFNADELRAFIEMLQIVADIGIILSLNLISKILGDVRFLESQVSPLRPGMRKVLSRGFCGDWRSG